MSRSRVLGIELIGSTAALNFEFSIANAETLLRIHDELGSPGPGRPEDRLDVLKRSAIILSITAWETYVEDLIEQRFLERLKSATEPEEVSQAFHSTAHSWLAEAKPKPPDLMHWSMDRWKVRVSDHFKAHLVAFNTPNSKNIRALSKRFIGQDLTRLWKWRGVTSTEAAKRLDDLVGLRGDLVHRGADYSRKNLVKKKQASDAIALCQRLVRCTEGLAPYRQAHGSTKARS